MIKNNQNKLIADEKDGFYKYPNLLSEALSVVTLPPDQAAICQYLLRRTLGWNQKEAAISLKEFAYVRNCDRTWISKQLKELQKKNIIIVTGVKDQKKVYRMNIDITSWDKDCIDIDRLINMPKGFPHIEEKPTLPSNNIEPYINDHAALPDESGTADEVLQSATTPVISKTEPLSSATTQGLSSATTPGWYCTTILEPVSSLEEWAEDAGVNTILNTNKYNKYTVYTIYFEEGVYYSLAKLLADNIPEQIKKEEPDLQAWAYVIDNMVTFDQRHPEEIKKIIQFAQQDEFWSKLILNTEKLRLHYDAIQTKLLMKNSCRRRNTKEIADKDKYDSVFTD